MKKQNLSVANIQDQILSRRYSEKLSENFFDVVYAPKFFQYFPMIRQFIYRIIFAK